MELEQHIFYKINNLTFEQKKNILYDAKELCYEWKVDKLDCSESCSRRQIEMSFDEIMKKFENTSHFVVINRKNRPMEKEHGEVAFSTLTSISYYLWIELDMNNFNKLLEKYNLNTIL